MRIDPDFETRRIQAFDSSTIVIRPIEATELVALEWNGEFSHFRNSYHETFERMQDGLAMIWVAADQQIIVGQVCIQYDCPRKELANGKTHAYLFAFRVKPAYRNHGLGKRMLLAVEDDLRAKGYNFLTLNVAKVNRDAQRFYKTNAFSIVASEAGNWSYIDQFGRQQHVHEPSWRFIKDLRN